VYETVGALASAVQQGKALYVGVSNYPTERAQEVAELLRQAGVPLLVHQPRYSIFDRSPEITGLLKLAAEDGFGLVAYSPLAPGLLTDKYLDGTIPAGARAANSSFLSPDQITDVYRERATALNGIAQERGQSLAQLALQWVLRQPQVHRPDRSEFDRATRPQPRRAGLPTADRGGTRPHRRTRHPRHRATYLRQGV